MPGSVASGTPSIICEGEASISVFFSMYVFVKSTYDYRNG